MPVAETAEQTTVELRGIVKRFGAVVANDRVDFSARPGEVHALVGENGAGKTTLMNVLFGLVPRDAGEIRLRGRPVEIGSPVDARRHRIGMVHQHFKLVPSLTVAENVFLGQEPARAGTVDRREEVRRVTELSERFGLAVDPRVPVGRLSVGLRQRVEILKALSYDAEVLILDEPTAVLTPQETDELFRIVRGFTAEGRTLIFITHKLNEVKQVADRFTVMRDGRRVATVPTAEASEEDIARLMVGREVLLRVERPPATPGPVLLAVEGLRARSDQGGPALRGVDLAVCAGEIVGIAGVEGNGQTELVEALAALRPLDGGRILLDGRDLSSLAVAARRRAGIAHVPEDRLERGVCAPMSVEHNIGAGHLERGLARRGLLELGRIRQFAWSLIRRYDIRGARPPTPVRALSGGNMQKVVLARELELEPRVLLAAQPTRGLDIGATEFVHRGLLAQRDKGAAILLVSADLNEVMALADRILVMYHGEVVAEFDAADGSEEEIGLAMTGVRRRDGRRPSGSTAPPPGRQPAPPARPALELPPERSSARERRLELGRRLASLALGTLQPALAVGLALAIGLLIVVGIGEDPLPAYRAFVLGSFDSLSHFGDMLAILTPLLLTGISVAISFRAWVWNIGAEGQLYVGALFGAWAAFTFVDVPGPLLVLFAFACGAAAGALWALLPAAMLAAWGVGEVVTTLMLNYVAILLTAYMINGPFKDPTAGAPVSKEIAPQAALPGILHGSVAHVGIFIALGFVVLAWFLVFRTRFGLSLRLVGDNPRFASYVGLSVPRIVVGTMLVSGAVAGVAGAVESLGTVHRFSQNFSPGWGWLGLTVALLGRLNPWGILAAGTVYAALTNGAEIMQRETAVPYPLVDILQGLIVVFMTAEGLLAWWQRRRALRGGEAAAEELAVRVAGQREEAA